MLLFDENLSFRLVKKLAFVFPGSVHVETVLYRGADDTLVEAYATERSLIIVTKDKDYTLRFSQAPKCSIVFVRLPNCTTDEIEALLRLHSRRILAIHSRKVSEYLLLPPEGE